MVALTAVYKKFISTIFIEISFIDNGNAKRNLVCAKLPLFAMLLMLP